MESKFAMIENNLNNINLKVREACEYYNIDFNKVKILPVTKFVKDREIFEFLISKNYKEFGENYYQELEQKANLMKNVTFHFIGHIQSNKVKKLCQISNLKYVHSLCRKKIAELFAHYQEHQIKFFIQVDYTKKENRNGIEEDKVFEFYDYCKSLGLDIIGLMTYPLEHQAEESYSKLSELKKKLEKEKRAKVLLSAGTSSDFELAIKYNTDILRIGRAIFKNISNNF
ncbi:MAG: alanine racemase [Candidatus Micrarchaeota archaeon]|nr:alanine racemase [Candidatus Micrarchaeota archaeon]